MNLSRACRVAIAWLLLSLVAACSTPTPTPTARPASGSDRAGNGGSPSVDVNGSLTDAQVRQRVSEDLGLRGWQLVGTTSNNADPEPNLFFAQFGTAQKTDRLVRVWTITIFSAARAATQKAPAVSTLIEIDCPGRTARNLQFSTFKDRSAVERGASFPGTQPAVAIVTGSAGERVAQRLCGALPTSGSGVVVAPGTVLTNRHVVAGCGALEAVRDGLRYPAQVHAEDSKVDLALVRVPTLPPPVTKTPFSLRLRRTAVTGESVMVAGFPLAGLLGTDMIVTTGIVNSLAGAANDPTSLQISAPVQPGNSGGPVLDKSGQLVGLVVSKLNALKLAERTGDVAQNVNFAIKPELVKRFLDSNQISLPMTDAGSRLETEEIAARARDVTLKLECRPKPPVNTSAKLAPAAAQEPRAVADR